MADLFDILPSEYGYVVLVVLFSWVVVQWMAVRVSSARKKYKVEYPAMYSDNNMFNCVQRVHQNTLEVLGYFIVLLLLGGLKHPRISAVSGLVWVVGRISYALGYYTGNPEKRLNGAYGYFGLFGLLGTTVSLALSLLGFV
ncbi:microsomal glutathione S-transferase 3-like [Acanthaster planci]|uniref:Glutathione S-transferase 3, mitochondrial n=1 Tax=Acanthaster planci TaxID=133434 RepID=A0A8B7YQ96_ACAPL|nr:microsomal glutathione S-transferase 3-like [Acanthaster planci]